jgi:oligopeptide/dipeptide ABC transporter ATP-binding protein
MPLNSEIILKVNDLTTSFDTEDGRVEVLDKISFDLHRGETLGIVGESGCGKSVTAFSIMRLLPKPSGEIDSGEIIYKGQNILSMDISDLHKIRGRRIAMIFQEPMTALNPVHRIGKQLNEVFRLHFQEMQEDEISSSSIELLKRVGIPDPDKRMLEYPHQLSGGMRQRAMIAMALACKPDILIADEPTTALDVTTQNQILNLMRDLQEEINMSIIFITHDLGVIAELCDRVIVMYAGKIVEKAEVNELFDKPQHPYTKGLLNSIPRLQNKAKSELNIIEGIVPGLNDLPSGCRFRTRCDFAINQCSELQPVLENTDESGTHQAACIRYQELA